MGDQSVLEGVNYKPVVFRVFGQLNPPHIEVTPRCDLYVTSHLGVTSRLQSLHAGPFFVLKRPHGLLSFRGRCSEAVSLWFKISLTHCMVPKLP